MQLEHVPTLDHVHRFWFILLRMKSMEQQPHYLRKAPVEETEQASVNYFWIFSRKTRGSRPCIHSSRGKVLLDSRDGTDSKAEMADSCVA